MSPLCHICLRKADVIEKKIYYCAKCLCERIGIYDRTTNAINSTQRNQSTKVRNEICSETTIRGLPKL